MKALTESGTEMADGQCEADKMPGLRGGRELMTTQVAKLVSTGRSWLDDWRGEVPAKVNFYHGGEPNGIATPRLVGARNDDSAWCWMKEAATKSWRRDLQMPVSSFYFGDGRESMTRFSLLPSLSRCQVITGRDGADGEDHYRCPCGALGNEGAGRSWVLNNTSNVSGVD
ncbi:MAG: hypothetical protein WBH01_04640 [Dehalococcoidia bacterium]